MDLTYLREGSAEQIKTTEGRSGIPSVSRHRRTPAYNFRQLSVGEGKEMGRERRGEVWCGRLVAECTSNAKHRQGRWISREPGESLVGPPLPPSPSPVTFAQVVESGGGRRGEERRRRAGRQSATVPNGGEESGEAEGKGPGRGHPPPPPSHSPAHPDYPQPGAGHTVMSIEEVLNFHSAAKFFILPSNFSKNSTFLRIFHLRNSNHRTDRRCLNR